VVSTPEWTAYVPLVTAKGAERGVFIKGADAFTFPAPKTKVEAAGAAACCGGGMDGGGGAGAATPLIFL
jgi:hypothetical protein